MLFTHYDLDGYGCAILITKFIHQKNKKKFLGYNNIDNEVSKYLDNISSNNKKHCEMLFITDISINEENAKRIDDLYKFGKFTHLLLVDHHPKNNIHLKEYEWTILVDDNISATKALYDSGYLKQFFLNDKDKKYYNKYTSIVEIIDDWDTFKWLEKGNIKARELNWIARESIPIEFVNRFCLNTNIDNWTIKENKIVSKKKRYIDSIIYNNNYILNGNTCYIPLGNNDDIGDIFLNMKDKFPECKIFVFINLNRQYISFRSVDDKYDTSKIAMENGGGGHPRASGSTISKTIFEEVIGKLLINGYKDYSKDFEN